MKEYIYKDTKFMNSIISQHKGGILKSSTIADSISSEDISTDISNSPELNIKGGGGYLGFVEGEISAKTKTSSKETSSSIVEGKENILNLLTLDKAYENLEEILVDYDEFYSENDFYKIINLEIVSSLILDEGMREYLINNEIKEQMKQFDKTISENANRAKRRENHNQIQKERKKISDDIRNDFESMLYAFNIIINWLPSNLLLVNSNASKVFPLELSNLILTPQQVSLYYKEIETTIVYKEIGGFGQSFNSNVFTSNDMYSQFETALNGVTEIIYSISGINKNSKLCMPITWYQNHERMKSEE